MKGMTVNYTVYAPTPDTEEEVKDLFYDDLQDAVPVGDVLIVAGDVNARPSPLDMTTWHILGRFALCTQCANGDRLVNFASTSRRVVSSTRLR